VLYEPLYGVAERLYLPGICREVVLAFKYLEDRLTYGVPFLPLFRSIAIVYRKAFLDELFLIMDHGDVPHFLTEFFEILLRIKGSLSIIALVVLREDMSRDGAFNDLTIHPKNEGTVLQVQVYLDSLQGRGDKKADALL